MNKPNIIKLAEKGQAILDGLSKRRLDSVRAIEAIRDWERRSRLLEKARTTHEALGDGATEDRYEREWEAYKTARNYAISTLTPLGKKLTVNGFHYRAVPSRCEIKVTPCKRPRKEPKR
jgi:hypothetical protein